MRVAIVGCGLIGARRAHVALAARDAVKLVVDVDESAVQKLAHATGAEASSDWRSILGRDDIDAVVVSTVNRELAPITIGALEAGKDVLCEKPLGRTSREAAAMVEAARAHGRILKTGFNHRHHPALARAKEIATEGGIGELFTLRIAYGHGGRPGYDREWRGDPELAGGGELLDQGIHVIDLARWFLGEVTDVRGVLSTFFWNIAPLEDNAYALLGFESNAIASVHTSWTQWRNLFRFELFGREGHLIVEGLGGSYGDERLTVGRRAAAGGPPSEEQYVFDGPDESWAIEWREFRTACDERREPCGSGRDGLAAARVVEAVYESARSGKAVGL